MHHPTGGSNSGWLGGFRCGAALEGRKLALPSRMYVCVSARCLWENEGCRYSYSENSFFVS